MIKIEDDNVKIAKKIMEANSVVSKKSHDIYYKQYARYIKQIARVNRKKVRYEFIQARTN